MPSNTGNAARCRRYRQRLRERTLYVPDDERVTEIANVLATRGLADGRDTGRRIVREVLALLDRPKPRHKRSS